MQYLSDAWLEAADAAVADLEPTAEPIAVSYTVTGGPDGDRSYTLSLGPSEVGVEPGRRADVGLTTAWDTACAIATNQRSAQRAFLDGDVRLDGDVSVLLSCQRQLEAVESRLAPLRSHTTY